MGSMRQNFLNEEFQITYRATTPSRRWRVSPHFACVGCAGRLSCKEDGMGRGQRVAVQWRNLTNTP